MGAWLTARSISREAFRSGRGSPLPLFCSQYRSHDRPETMPRAAEAHGAQWAMMLRRCLDGHSSRLKSAAGRMSEQGRQPHGRLSGRTCGSTYAPAVMGGGETHRIGPRRTISAPRPTPLEAGAKGLGVRAGQAPECELDRAADIAFRMGTPRQGPAFNGFQVSLPPPGSVRSTARCCLPGARVAAAGMAARRLSLRPDMLGVFEPNPVRTPTAGGAAPWRFVRACRSPTGEIGAGHEVGIRRIWSAIRLRRD